MEGVARGIMLSKDGWPNDRWNVAFVGDDYPRPKELVFTDWTDEEIKRVSRLIAEIECARHGHIICPAAEDGCCDGRNCYKCRIPFTDEQHRALMREQNGRDCGCLA